MSEILRKAIAYTVLPLLLVISARLASGQAVTTWGLQLIDNAIHVSGQTSRSGVGAATYNGKLYAAYSDHSGDGNLWLTYQLNQYNHSTPVEVPGAIVNNNPQLAAYDGKLFISWVDPSGLIYFTSTTDGLTFSNQEACDGMVSNDPYAEAYDSPSMAVLGSNLYIGFRTPKNGFGVCKIMESSSDNYAYAIYPNGFSLGEAPGLGAFNGELYVAYKDTTGSNYIYLAETTDGVNYTFSTAAASNHTSGVSH